LHNSDVFPSGYPDLGPVGSIRAIGLFCKATLELCCFLKVVPAIVLTNDWFTGLVAAYSKTNQFGDTFKGTTFFHICHNLEASYEGRIYHDPRDTLENVYKLPNHFLIDPYNSKKFLNPSRCAIMLSDQWGTVSKSYRKDLQETSGLNGLLNNHPRVIIYFLIFSLLPFQMEYLKKIELKV
jgi:starch synthase